LKIGQERFALKKRKASHKRFQLSTLIFILSEMVVGMFAN
jgi:hypothetical protein